ncbi:zinc finger protein Xfin [Cydia strobilella]|uniref:zinc finger protein Xfin n=1 Tax=Cydia strobilella TaxID=1100964 RepID=UPI0030049010
MTSTDTYQLKWHSHSSHLNGSVAALLRSERFTDVVLCTMDGSQIPAHKFILSSCSVYLSGLFEGQRHVTRMGGMLYVVLPSEISTKALKILVEYMYKGETTVSNEVLDTVLKAGEVLKIRGLWRQTDEAGDPPAEKTTTQVASVNKQPVKKPEDLQPKIAVKKDDKLLKSFTPMQQQGVTRPMFIGPPKLVFIKTTEGGTQAAIRSAGPKGQTILVAPAPSLDTSTTSATTTTTSTSIAIASTTIADDSPDEAPAPRILRRHAAERKYGKRQKPDDTDDKDADDTASKKSTASNNDPDVSIKEEPEWDASSIEEEERSIAEMFQQEMSVKQEPEDLDIDEEGLVYSPLACELCAEVFTLPAAWVRHVQGHARADHTHARKRKHRSAVRTPLPSTTTGQVYSPLACELCAEVFTLPAAWVRHVQGHARADHTHARKRKHRSAVRTPLPSTTTGQVYSPLACELCAEVFTLPAAWVRHVQGHARADHTHARKRKHRSAVRTPLPSTTTGQVYSPLACELCAEVFTLPAAWVRHVQGHARADHTHARKRKHRSASDDTEETMALLRCDLCQKHFPNPAEWVRHVQSTHTETELAISNNSAPPKRHNRFTEGAQNKTCSHCKKTFPSHASMLIHMRTHTGERPFVCGLCNKGFNVKSNLLRHLRTLHDQIISPALVEGEADDETEGPSEVKRES